MEKPSRMLPDRSPLGANVGTARDIANRLIVSESRGPGDIENAMRRLESRRGVPFSLLRALRYDHGLKDILLSQWNILLSAYELECARQKRLYEAELARTKALKDAANSILTRAALAVAPEDETQ